VHADCSQHTHAQRPHDPAMAASWAFISGGLMHNGAGQRMHVSMLRSTPRNSCDHLVYPCECHLCSIVHRVHASLCEHGQGDTGDTGWMGWQVR
jgi:hypothetical protein